VVRAYHEFLADAVVVEGNQGGDAWEVIIKSVDNTIRVLKVTAKQGKRLRAEPAGALYEQRRIHHVGNFPELEDEWTTWVIDSGESPDRMDAEVHALAELGLVTYGQGQAFLEMWKGNSGKADHPATVPAKPFFSKTPATTPPEGEPDVVRCKKSCFIGSPDPQTGKRVCRNCGLPPLEVVSV
jgi:hypothetical protein